MQAIAAENNLSETLFWFPQEATIACAGSHPRSRYRFAATLPWPSAAVGHGASGAWPQQGGLPFGERAPDGQPGGYGLRHGLPCPPSEPVATPPVTAEALGVGSNRVFVNSFNYMVLLENTQVLRELTPDMAALARMDRSGVIVTAQGDGTYDFVSRYFCPAKGVAEDPVTGGAHCMLAPYWAKRLGKTAFRAYQASKRGGEMICRLVGDRVELEGGLRFYLEGEVEI